MTALNRAKLKRLTSSWGGPQVSLYGAVTSFNSRSGAINLTTSDINLALGYTPPPATTYTVVTKTAGYTETVTTGELLIKADLAGGFTIVLPTAVGNKAKIHIKKIQAAGSIIIDANASETIDGGLTATLTNQYELLTLISDNVNWMII